MALRKLDTYIEKEETKKWMDKKEYINKEVIFTIDDVLDADGNLVLELVDGTNNQLVQIPFGVKNAIIDKLGTDTREWRGANICLKFSEFIPKAGQKVNAGVKIELVPEVEEQTI